MKVLIDTNIILDFALERQPFYSDSEQVFILAQHRQIEAYVSASTFGDLFYIIRKARGRDWTLQFLNRLATFCQIATVDRSVISMALSANFKDFEDAIQYSTAIVNQLDSIVTRNPEDFPAVTPRILTPEQLIQELM
ncbi:MAG TPA: PIN domain nuclease [Cyanobacteria bacterium UBA11162]|nr:PIN domain nuclease [Cyanobacteria bacterium UBA11162]